MPAVSAAAPGKVILFGEHAVVYSQPAIAVPVTQVQARAVVTATPTAESGTVLIDAPDIHLLTPWKNLPEDHPLKRLLSLLAEFHSITTYPAFRLRITSTIPVAAGLGSGAAVSVAVIRAVSAFLGRVLSDEQVSALAYEVEKSYHGTPSGIDNTVITFARPIYFVRGNPFEPLRVAQPFTLIVADSGVKSITAEVVGDLRRRRQQGPGKYDLMFAKIGTLVQFARTIIENGPWESLGNLMNQNHALLQSLDVSCPELDRLVDAALQNGALGAKLCGAGKGGNLIALVRPDAAESVAQALQRAGAVRTLRSDIVIHEKAG
jgi:mevalonate kinase